MQHKKRNESGQVLVIMAVAMVGLIGFLALAIDGGTIFSDRRYDQNAADASAMAGALAAAQVFEDSTNLVRYESFNCSSPSTGLSNAISQASAKAIARAADNNFTIAGDLSTQHGVTVTCTEQNMGGYFDKYLDVTVMISTDVETSFAHLFYPGPIRNTVQAVARVRPRTPAVFGNALVALKDNPNCDQPPKDMTMVFDGGVDLTITGSGFYTNACLDSQNATIVTTTGKNSYVVDWVEPNQNKIVVKPADVSAVIPGPDIPPVDCAALKAANNYGDFVSNNPSDVFNLSPGYYNSFTVSKGTVTLSKGIYCIKGDVTMSGGTITGDDMMFYLEEGGFTTTANAVVDIKALREDNTDVNEQDWTGILIYQVNPAEDLILIGNSLSTYNGTVFAPKSNCEIGGNTSAHALDVQIICYTIKNHGSTIMNIVYSGSKTYTSPAYIDFYR